MQNVEEIIKDAVVMALNYRVPSEEITGETNLLTDLLIDSLAYVQLVIDLEEKFNIEMNEEIMDINAMQIYSDFVNAVLKAIAENE